jgi:hypothetical protein
VPFGPDTSELEADLAKIERCLRALDGDKALSPQARKLRRTYYSHRRDKLWPHLVRLKHARKVQSCERELRQKRKALDLFSGNATDDEIKRKANECEQAENVLSEARAELDARSSALIDLPGESWEAITPRELLLAVTHIRGDFERLEGGICFNTEQQCFKELHPVTAGNAEPAVFREHFWDCIRRLCAVVYGVFPRFVEISRAQKGTIGQAPIEWAALQVRDLIEHGSRTINHWVKSACDKPDYDIKSFDLKTTEELVFRTDWRAPKWLRMKPNGNAPYDPSTAWDRMDEDETRRVLKSLREDQWVLSLEATLEQLVGSAHEVLAKRKTHAAPGSQEPAKVTTQQGTPKNRLIDPRKELIAGLKARNPNRPARKICELIDRQIASTPIRRAILAPLEPWQRKAPGKRSWVEVYDHAKTRNLVRSYVNKVPPLKTAKSPK